MKNHKYRLSRRDFLKFSSQAGLYIGLSSCTSFDRRIWGQKTRLQSEVLILGAGLSGLSAALHLKQRQIPYVIYEAQDRVGGRVLSLSNPINSSEFIDMGGQFVDSHHDTFRKLSKEFFFTLEKKREFKLPLSEMQELARWAGADFTDLDAMSFSSFLAQTKKVSAESLKKLRQIVLMKWGVPSESLSALPVCLQFNLFKGPIEIFEFPESTAEFMDAFYHRVAGTDFGQNIQHGHELVEIKEYGDGFELLFLKQNKEIRIQCLKLICGLPLPALSKIKGFESLNISERKKYWIQEASYSHHRRIFIPQTAALEGADRKEKYRKEMDQVDYFIERLKSGLQVDAMSLDLVHLKERLTNTQILTKSMELKSILQADWSSMKFQKGKGVFYKPNTFLDFMYAMNEPEYGKQLYFAGEHTSLEYSGTMNGAVESGIWAAQNII
ncbi:MAG TPA: FAD-dependent oxidoreductase [Pseudobdellovibrionaceae bacterium]|nr:FAD-dependent oxidoreductase [Pseudobdellovibrionaceae bacterium]